MTLPLKLLLLLSVVARSPVALADALDRIRERDQLIVAVKNEGNPDRAAHKDPAHFQKRNYELALAGAIAARLLGEPGKLRIETLRKPERLPAVVDGRVDIGLSMFRIVPASVALVDFSVPYHEAATSVMQRATGGIREPGDLAGRRIGIIARNDAGPEPLLGQGPDGQRPALIREFASFDDAAAAIEAEEIDGLLSDAVNIDVYLAGRGGVLVRSPVLSRSPIGVAVPKGNPALLREIDALLRAYAEDGTLARLQRQHGLSKNPPVP
jgi:ABC-type amino acid transport substrate-binding protein